MIRPTKKLERKEEVLNTILENKINRYDRYGLKYDLLEIGHYLGKLYYVKKLLNELKG